MVFSSLEFLFVFLPVFLVLYYCLPGKWRNTLLFAGSILFYGIGEPTYLLLILLSVLVNYLLGRGIEACGKHIICKRGLLIVSLLYNFGLLFYFKYMDFFLENINLLLKHGGSSVQFTLLHLVLPLGISFYTFQIVSYLIDVYRGSIPAEKSLINLGAYLCMFPQLIAGPIVVYSDINEELKKRSLSITNIDEGLKVFILGLGSKVILANRIGTLWSDVCMIGFETISTPLAWLGAAAYSLQLYFDFWGYSLMAIGLGKMLGFTIPENFHYPYTSRSVTDFWRRWHMTLGAWFREYVYIPLGGNRKGKFRTSLHLFIVWFLVGFWHGADWNFIVWGLLIFVLQVIEKNFLLSFLRKDSIIAKIISHAYILLYILVSWTVFAISDFGQLGVYLAKMFPFFGSSTVLNSMDFLKYLNSYAPLLIVCIIFCTELPKRLWKKLERYSVSLLVFLAIFWCSVYYLSIGLNNPFLYFRF